MKCQWNLKCVKHLGTIEIQDLKIDKPLQKLALQTIIRTDFKSKEILPIT